MKKKHLLAAGVMILLNIQYANLIANDLFRITHKNGTTTNIPIDAIRNIVFTPEEEMRVDVNGLDSDFSIVNIGNIMFSTYTELDEIRPLEQQDLKLYPNPVKDYLNLQYRTDGNEKVMVKIYDLKGRLIQNHTYDAIEMTAGVILPVQNLPEGLYLCRIQTSQAIVSAKFIKYQH